MTDAAFTALCDSITADMSRCQVPGVAVGVWSDGHEYTAGFGVTSVDNPLPVTPETLFQIGSISKTFTATALMHLVEEGKVDIEAPVRSYLPGFKVQSENDAASVRVRHLVTHTAGWVGDYFRDTGRGDDAVELIVAKMAKSPQLTPVGETFSYNNAAFYVAGRIIEVVTGASFETAVRRLVTDPLGLSSTWFCHDDLLTYRVASGHIRMPDGPKVARPWRLDRSASPAGGLVSTVGDQLRYARFHLGDGTATHGGRVLSPASVVFMRQPLAEGGCNTDAIGFSWMLRDVGGTRLVMHTGGTNGQIAVLALAPQQAFAISVLTNADSGAELQGRAITRALKEFLGIEQPPAAIREVPAGDLQEYTATYAPVLAIHEISATDNGLLLQSRSPGPMPLSDGRLQPPPPPPIPLGFYDTDRVIALEGASAGSKGEFLRDASGTITWFRWGGRIGRRQP